MRRSGVDLRGRRGGGRAERNGGLAGRAQARGMHGGSPPHGARHGEGCAVGESELGLDLRRSAGRSAWCSPRMERRG